MLIFDIETGPLPDEQLRTMHEPPEMPERPAEFDESSVRIGNLKDKAKIAAKIDEAKQRHQAEVDGYDAKCKAIAGQAWQDFKGNAALDAVTGRVLAIGYYNPDRDKFVADYGDEYVTIANFWQKADACRRERRSLIGLNTHDFDLPFLMRRSWIVGVDVPRWVIQQNRFFEATFVDLRKVWLCGQYGANCRSNFDHLSRAFATNGKPDGITGGQFAELFESDREKAIEYLKNDVKQPAKWAAMMGVL